MRDAEVLTRRGVDAVSLLVLEGGRRWGDAATPEQRADVAAVLDVAAEQRMHWLGRSRGRSKTTDVAAMSLAALLVQLPAGAQAYAAAADRDQARLLLDAARGFVQRTPELAGAVDVQAGRIVAHSPGVVLEVLAADAASSWGLRPYWLVCDELCQWPDTRGARAFWEALSTALPKVPSSRGLVMTTAGDPAHWSRRVYEGAVAEPELWRVSDMHGPPPWIPAARIESERRRLLPSSFARLWLNEWAAGEDRLVHPDDLAACTVLDGPQPYRSAHRYVAALDVGVVNDRTVLAVAHAEAVDGATDEDRVRVVLDRLMVWEGSRSAPVSLDEVTATVQSISREYRAPVVYDPHQAAQLSQQLRSAGVHAEQFVFSSTSVGALATVLFTLLRSRRLALPDDRDLADELANVRLRTNSAGVVRMDHDAGRHDDRAVALGMAAWHLLRHLGGGPQFFVDDQPAIAVGSRYSPLRQIGPFVVLDERLPADYIPTDLDEPDASEWRW